MFRAFFCRRYRKSVTDCSGYLTFSCIWRILNLYGYTQNQTRKLRGSRRKRGSHLNRNKDRSGAGGKGGFPRGKNQRGGIPLAAIGRKIMPAELVSEKLEKQERKKSESAANNSASVSKKISAEGNAKAAAPRHANVQRAQQRDTQPRAKTPVRIIPLGGLGEIGKNMTVIECANDMFIIDCGLAFPDAEMLGVDLVIPDFTYIERNAEKLRGIVLTHGHEDHIGGLAYLLKKVNTPVYGTRLTLALVEAKLKEHQLKRLRVFLFPDRDILGDGYNLRQARISIGSGSWWGKGLGKGALKQLGYLPPAVSMNDFIFAVLAEELGFMGCLSLLLLYLGILLSGLRVAWRCRDDRGRLLAIGVCMLVFSHVYVNIAMSIGLMPITGLPLPLVSAGRTFLVVIMAALGLLQSVAVHGELVES